MAADLVVASAAISRAAGGEIATLGFAGPSMTVPVAMTSTILLVSL
jgi:hypothetical protein